MGYYVDIQPRDKEPLTLAAFEARLLDAGMERHPGRDDPDEEPEYRQKLEETYTLMHPGGVFELFEDKQHPCGIAASARFSWVNYGDCLRILLLELVNIVNRAGADVLGPQGETITPDNVSLLVEQNKKQSAIARSMFGTMGPRQPQEPPASAKRDDLIEL